LAQSEDRTTIAVHNDGSPISPEDQSKLFDAFKRTDSARRGGQHGWGLGLTLVKGIAESHGGSVSVESAAGRGTTFTIMLPTDARQHKTG
jgi:signal transduction histidine kinase